jgi:demethylspheroidene O-methyltransferase
MSATVRRGGQARREAQHSRGEPVSLADRWRGLRDRLLTNRSFLTWATAFPLTRPIARYRSRALFDLCAGFVYSQVLAACVHLRLFDCIAEGPQPARTLADRLGLPADATARLLDAAVSLRLAENRGAAGYGLGPLGAAIIGVPGTAEMIEHHAILYADLADPIGLLRGKREATGLARYWSYAGSAQPKELGAEDVAAYSALMTASQPLVASQILAALPLGRHRRLLDVGGGEGAFVIAAARRAPHLHVALFDLPAVADRAEVRFKDAGIDSRAEAVGGDFLFDPLPAGADLITLVRVLHDHNDAAARAILASVRRALSRGGTVAIAEPLAGARGAVAVGGAYFAFYLLAMGSGRPRRFAEIRELLAGTGFSRIREVRTFAPLVASLILADVKP